MLESVRHMDGSPSFFLAGTMQGSRPGIEVMNQGYRDELRRIISGFYPASKLLCPLEILTEKFGTRRSEMAAHYANTVSAGILEATAYDDQMKEILTAFTELVRLAATTDVVVAYIPDHEASMGTAMEIWSAYAARRVVIGISPMRHNLALVSTCAVVLPTLADFEEFLRKGRLGKLALHRRREHP